MLSFRGLISPNECDHAHAIFEREVKPTDSSFTGRPPPILSAMSKQDQSVEAQIYQWHECSPSEGSEFFQQPSHSGDRDDFSKVDPICKAAWSQDAHQFVGVLSQYCGPIF
jgi:hypothetical protein